MTGLILKPEGWHLIERLPEEPKKTCAGKPFCCEGRRCDHLAYQEALQQAIDGAILVGNQDKPEVRDLIWRLWSHSPEGGVTVQKGKVYPVEVEYEISEEPEYPIDHTSYPPYGKVAILHPVKTNSGRRILSETPEDVKKKVKEYEKGCWFCLYKPKS